MIIWQRRDAEWMGKVHEFLGLTVGCGTELPWTVKSDVKQYNCDITYITNNETGFRLSA